MSQKSDVIIPILHDLVSIRRRCVSDFCVMTNVSMSELFRYKRSFKLFIIIIIEKIF